MSFIDKAIGFISPRAELERTRYRMAVNELRKYDAASSGRRTAGWRSTEGSANTEIGPDLSHMRNRSRELVRNNPYAKRAIEVIASNTVGSGIRATIIAGKNQDKIEDAWNKWAETTACDFSGMLNLYGIQTLAMRAVAESGECIIRRRTTTVTAENKIPFKLQILEPEYLCLFRDTPLLDNGGYIMQGVEFDKNGKRVAYFIYRRHPSEALNTDFDRIPADQVIHIFKIDRPGQVRGVPFGVSAALKLRDFADYEDAQLVRQKIAACFSVFVQDASADSITGSSTVSPLPERVEPGMIEHLEAGKTVTFASPPAAEGYEAYTKKVLQGIAAGYGVTYEALTGDLSNVNFSSGRMGWLEFHRLVEDWQENMLIPRLCSPIFEWFMLGAQISLGFKDANAQWTPPRREMIDPVKESKGLSLQVRNGFSSWSEAVRSMGYDPKKLIAEMKKDNEAFDANGLVLDCDGRKPEAAAQPDNSADNG